MALNTSPDRFGGARNPLQPGGVYVGKVIREHGDGTVTVFVKLLGSKIGPIKVINYTPSSVPNVGEQVLVSFLDNMLNDMVVIGRVTPRVDQLSITDNLIVDSSTADTLVRFTQRGTGDVLRVEDSVNPDSTPLIITADGSVGIGLASPSKKLHVSGDAQITGDFTVGTSTLFFDVSEDSLGIGTTTPAAKLHVTGSTSGELVRITQTGAGAALLVEDATNPDSTPFIIDASGNVGIGTTSPSATVDVSGSTVISGDLTVDTTTLKVDSSNNRVGIGTASPLVALDVIGQVIARAAATQDGVRLLGRAGGTGYYDVALTPTTLSADRTLTLPDVSGTVITTGNLSDITLGGTFASLEVAGDFTVDTNTLRVDSTNNRVGINVTSPAHALDVIGRVEARAAATQDGIAIVGRSGGTSSYDVTLTPTTLSADRTLTLPNVSGTVVTTGDTGSVTSTMILDGTIVNGDINASAAIADTKLATISTAGKVSNSATTATSSNTASAIVARDASGNFTAGTITATTFSGGLAASNLTGQTGMWTSAGRPGATRLYRNDFDDQYNVQTYWTGSRWRLYGYYGSSGHADTHVGYADSAGSASTASVASTALGGGGGIAYPGATIGGGAANNIGFRWANPVVNCTVDNVISAEAANFSDRRLKINIASYDDGLPAIRNLRPVTFNPLDIISFTDEGEPVIGDNDPYDEMLGFVADEVQEVIPSAVSGTGNQLKSISTLQILSVAVAAIKELDAKVTSLMERIEALESK